MTDTLKRLTNPTVPVKNNDGSSIYTPGGSTITAVKHAIVANSSPWDAYITLGLNDLRVASNLLVPSILVPAFRSVPVPLDAIVSGAASDVVKALQRIGYQDSYGSASLLQTPAVLTNGTGNSGAGSTVVSGSWTSVTGTLYLATIAWSKAAAPGTISSFTDTRGLTWTEIYTLTAADGLSKLAVYAAVATSASAATTTVNFSASQDLSAIAITNVALTGTFDDTTANGVDGIAAYGWGEDVRSTTTPVIPLYGPGWHGSNRLVSLTANGAATTETAPTGYTELNDVGTNKTLATLYSLGSTATALSSSFAPTLAAGNGRSLAIACEVQERRSPLAVTLYGVEVT